jgi:hypothetical protein
VERFPAVFMTATVVMVLVLVIAGLLGSIWHVGPMAEIFKVHQGGGYGPEGFPL